MLKTKMKAPANIENIVKVRMFIIIALNTFANKDMLAK